MIPPFLNHSSEYPQSSARVVTQIIWSPQALRDIEAIRAYITEDSPRVSELVVGRIVKEVERLKAVDLRRYTSSRIDTDHMPFYTFKKMK